MSRLRPDQPVDALQDTAEPVATVDAPATAVDALTNTPPTYPVPVGP